MKMEATVAFSYITNCIFVPHYISFLKQCGLVLLIKSKTYFYKSIFTYILNLSISVFEFKSLYIFSSLRTPKLDHVYSNIKDAYRAAPLPHLGQSDHCSLLLLPKYTPLRRKTKLVTKIIKTWPEESLSQLQDCFERTDWEVFEHQDLEQ